MQIIPAVFGQSDRSVQDSEKGEMSGSYVKFHEPDKSRTVVRLKTVSKIEIKSIENKSLQAPHPVKIMSKDENEILQAPHPPPTQITNGTSNMYKCYYCDIAYDTYKALLTHKSTHDKNQDKPYECGICKVRFHDRTGMLEHKKRHGVLNPFSCPFCPSEFPTFDDLKIHRSSHSQ